jgi:hypothetical protein
MGASASRRGESTRVAARSDPRRYVGDPDAQPWWNRRRHRTEPASRPAPVAPAAGAIGLAAGPLVGGEAALSCPFPFTLARYSPFGKGRHRQRR